MFSLAAFGMNGETHPIPLKERLKWQLWVQGLPEFKRPVPVQVDEKREDLDRVLRKLNL